jgi:hypothetical protein
VISTEIIVKVVAVVVAAVVAAWPYLPRWPSYKESPQADEATAVLAIARRLQASGNKQGVSVCQQLLAILLEAAK